LPPSPPSQKAAIITQVLKKSDANPDELKGYRPISNLTFISKVIERIVVDQITRHLDNAYLMPPLQSAYRRNHSTETALMKIVSDILNAADVRKVTLLGLLDLSAAFDTVDHVILLRGLEVSFGLNGSVLEWFRSFLAKRSQAVTFHGITSDYTPLLHGVPQGSVLGPLLFILYTAEVVLIAAQHGIDLHSYADDTYIAAGCSSTDASKSAFSASTLHRRSRQVDVIQSAEIECR